MMHDSDSDSDSDSEQENKQNDQPTNEHKTDPHQLFAERVTPSDIVNLDQLVALWTLAEKGKNVTQEQKTNLINQERQRQINEVLNTEGHLYNNTPTQTPSRAIASTPSSPNMTPPPTTSPSLIGRSRKQRFEPTTTTKRRLNMNGDDDFDLATTVIHAAPLLSVLGLMGTQNTSAASLQPSQQPENQENQVQQQAPNSMRRPRNTREQASDPKPTRRRII